MRGCEGVVSAFGDKAPLDLDTFCDCTVVQRPVFPEATWRLQGTFIPLGFTRTSLEEV